MLSRNEDLIGIAAQDTLNSTRAAIIEGKKVRIATTLYSNATYQFITKQIGDYIIEEGRNSVKVIIRVACRERNLN